MTEQMKGDEMAETDEKQPTEVDGSEGRETFTPRQQQLLAALVGDASVQAAAERVGVSRTTAHHWMQQPAFAKELARQRDAVLTEALAGVQTQAGRAAAKLGALLDVEDPEPTGSESEEGQTGETRIHRVERQSVDTGTDGGCAPPQSGADAFLAGVAANACNDGEKDGGSDGGSLWTTYS